MKRVTDFLAASNFTEGVRLPLPLAVIESRFCALSLNVSCMIAFQSRGEPKEIFGMLAKGKGEKFFLSLSSDSVFLCREAIAKAPETCAPAWIVQPQ